MHSWIANEDLYIAYAIDKFTKANGNIIMLQQHVEFYIVAFLVFISLN